MSVWVLFLASSCIFLSIWVCVCVCVCTSERVCACLVGTHAHPHTHTHTHTSTHTHNTPTTHTHTTHTPTHTHPHPHTHTHTQTHAHTHTHTHPHTHRHTHTHTHIPTHTPTHSTHTHTSHTHTPTATSTGWCAPPSFPSTGRIKTTRSVDNFAKKTFASPYSRCQSHGGGKLLSFEDISHDPFGPPDNPTKYMNNMGDQFAYVFQLFDNTPAPCVSCPTCCTRATNISDANAIVDMLRKDAFISRETLCGGGVSRRAEWGHAGGCVCVCVCVLCVQYDAIAHRCVF